jgi:hypothetical protein
MKNNNTLFHFLCSNSLRRFANKNSCAEKNTITAKSIHKRWILMPLLVFGLLFTKGNVWGQTTVTYAQRVAHYNAGSVFAVGTAGAFDKAQVKLVCTLTGVLLSK